jgi:phosphoglycerol geranylgeranyltransferase
MNNHIYQQMLLAKQEGKKKFAVLIDPDKLRLDAYEEIVQRAIESRVDYFFIGGSLIVNDVLDNVLVSIRKKCDIPLVLFPGNSYQLSYRADAILFLSLISGRNADLLIGKHVIAAPFLKLSPLEVLPTGYMLIDGGKPTTVSYMSNTVPIPANKSDIALATALAGEYLGLKLIFMDAGSGAELPVSSDMIQAVSSVVDIPLIVGGGIRTPEKIEENLQAGADIIVIGDAIEKDASLLLEFSDVFHRYNSKIPT